VTREQHLPLEVQGEQVRRLGVQYALEVLQSFCQAHTRRVRNSEIRGCVLSRGIVNGENQISFLLTGEAFNFVEAFCPLYQQPGSQLLAFGYHLSKALKKK
jgi:hypothetical protein